MPVAQNEQRNRFLADMDEFNGFGIAILPGGFGVKANLSRGTGLVLPLTIDGGVPLIVEVVGSVAAAGVSP